jgi:hypothetical protein
MPRAEIRAAIQSYLTAANVPLLGKVYQHPPKYTAEGEFVLTGYAGIGAGAVVFIHLQEQYEMRAALGGPTSGKKRRIYAVELLCVLREKKPSTEQAGADNDTFLDGLTAAIEANRTANSTVVFQWGEGDTLEGMDIKVEAGFPRPIREQTSQVFSRVTVTVVEFLTT